MLVSFYRFLIHERRYDAIFDYYYNSTVYNDLSEQVSSLTTQVALNDCGIPEVDIIDNQRSVESSCYNRMKYS